MRSGDATIRGRIFWAAAGGLAGWELRPAWAVLVICLALAFGLAWRRWRRGAARAAPEDRPPSSLFIYESDYPERYRRYADSARYRGPGAVPGPTPDDPDRGRIVSIPILDSSEPPAS